MIPIHLSELILNFLVERWILKIARNVVETVGKPFPGITGGACKKFLHFLGVLG